MAAHTAWHLYGVWDNLHQRDAWQGMCIVPWSAWPCSDCQVTSHLQLCNITMFSRSWACNHYWTHCLCTAEGVQILLISGNVIYMSFVGSKATPFLICLTIENRKSLERKKSASRDRGRAVICVRVHDVQGTQQCLGRYRCFVIQGSRNFKKTVIHCCHDIFNLQPNKN